MVSLSLKDVPEALAEQLRQRAARNHRSLQGELMAIIEQAVHGAESPLASALPQPPIPTARGHGQQVIRRGTKTTEQIAAEHRVRFPQPISAGPLAVDILRAERDAR